jgi:hypothetical protein
MTEWKKVGMDAGVGAVAGVADQMIQNWDEKRALAARALPSNDPKYIAPDKKMPILFEAGTYVNYGLPLLTVVGVSMGWVKGDMATRLTTASFQLAGRKGTHRFTTNPGGNNPSKTPAAAYTQLAKQAAAQAAAREAAARDLYRAAPNPEPIQTGQAVPIVQPQSLFGGRGELG